MLRNQITWKDPQEYLKNSGRTLKTHTPRTSIVTVEEDMEMLHDKLSPVPERSAYMFHHNFYPKSKVDLEDADISKETRQNY